MLLGRNKLTQQDIQDMKLSIESIVTSIKSISQLQQLENPDLQTSMTFTQLYQLELVKRKKNIDKLASISSNYFTEVDSILHDASTLIQLEKSSTEQNNQLINSLNHLQNEYIAIRDQNELLKNQLISSALNYQRLQEQKEELIITTRKMRQQFNQINHIFQQQNSRLKCQLTALTKSQINAQEMKEIELSQELVKMKILQTQIKKLKQMYEQQKKKNLSIQKQLELSQKNFKEMQNRFQYQFKKFQKSIFQHDISHDISSQIIQRMNLKYQLDLHNSFPGNFSEQKVPQEQSQNQGSNQGDVLPKQIKTYKVQDIKIYGQSQESVQENINKQVKVQKQQKIQLQIQIQDKEQKIELVQKEKQDQIIQNTFIQNFQNSENKILIQPIQSKLTEEIIDKIDTSFEKQIKIQQNFKKQLQKKQQTRQIPYIQSIIPQTHFYNPIQVPLFSEGSIAHPLTENHINHYNDYGFDQIPFIQSNIIKTCSQIANFQDPNFKMDQKLEQVSQKQQNAECQIMKKKKKRKKLWLRSMQKLPMMYRQTTKGTSTTQNFSKKSRQKFVLPTPKLNLKRSKFQNVVLDKKPDVIQKCLMSRCSSNQALKSP